MRAVFKADGDETRGTYSISEWTLEPGCGGVGAHRHDANDDVFYVIEGTAEFLLDGETIVAPAGTFVRVAPGVEHDFFNRSEQPVRFLNIYVPGGFEDDMPGIVDWFATHPDGASTAH
jgi:mannose-6-phosphate isomerase-like protein (cupin superfamily)